MSKKGKITQIKEPKAQGCDNQAEVNLVSSILRREGIKPQIFSYKNYKNRILVT